MTDRNNWDVTGDGRRFLVNATENQTAQATGSTPPITVIVDWLAGQARKDQ